MKKVTQIRASQIRASQIRASQIRASQIKASQIRASQIRASQIRATKISSNHRELHGTCFGDLRRYRLSTKHFMHPEHYFGQGTFYPPCHMLHYHMVLRPKGTSHNDASLRVNFCDVMLCVRPAFHGLPETQSSR